MHERFRGHRTGPRKWEFFAKHIIVNARVRCDVSSKMHSSRKSPWTCTYTQRTTIHTYELICVLPSAARWSSWLTAALSAPSVLALHSLTLSWRTLSYIYTKKSHLPMAKWMRAHKRSLSFNCNVNKTIHIESKVQVSMQYGQLRGGICFRLIGCDMRSGCINI